MTMAVYRANIDVEFNQFGL